jgi:hypothetical protein
VIKTLKIERESVEEWIGPLTYDETRRAVEDLKSATTAKAARKILEAASQSCSMNSKQNPRDEKSPTWANAIVEQIGKRVRL